MFAIAVEWHGAADRIIGTVALVAMFDEQLLIEQAPPNDDGLAGDFGIDFVGDPGDRNPAVNADEASFGLAREGAEAFPCTHRPHAVIGEIGEPVLSARMLLRAVVFGVVIIDEPSQPAVCLGLALRLVEVVQGFVRVLHRAKRPFDLALGARGRPSAV